MYLETNDNIHYMSAKLSVTKSIVGNHSYDRDSDMFTY